MQVLILYYSRGGNTRKLAEYIAEGVREVAGVQALLREPGEVTKEDFVHSAGLIAGSPVYFGGMAAELKKVFDDFVGVPENGRQGRRGLCHLGGPIRRQGDHHDVYHPVPVDLRDDRRRRSPVRYRSLRSGLHRGPQRKDRRAGPAAGETGGRTLPSIEIVAAGR